MASSQRPGTTCIEARELGKSEARLCANRLDATLSTRVWGMQVMSYFGGGGQQAAGGGNRYLTERNAERLADALCRMRGAALKLGQMISIQDENVLPPQVHSLPLSAARHAPSLGQSLQYML